MEKRPDPPTDPLLPIEPSTETFILGRDALAEPSRKVQLSPLERGTAVGRYLILDRLGEGGMGVVYAAHDPELDRRVALKLLRPDRAAKEAALRLQREAQAIARLSHPNVVAVHDAGTFGDQVFVAMELVEGRTVRQWLAAEKPPWREIVTVFVAAGRGLAAAHAAGLAHRDFKPDNVLLGRDGRVRVVDFGLARPVGEPGAGTGGTPEEGSPTPSSGVLATPLTQWGAALGTPSYMAPEQLRGEGADARSDQFSFCVALYEALYGERPFPGGNPREIAEAVTRGAVREEPAGSRVPARLRAVLLRGLSRDPERRFPSMAELLDQLERDPAARRRQWLAAAAILVVAGALFASLGYFQARRQQLCGGAEEKLAGVWDDGRKSRIHAAFLATRVPFADRAWREVEAQMNRWAEGWAGMRREACEATRLRGEQSEDLLDRRMFCLDQRLRETRALTDLFAQADTQVVEKAVNAVAGLGRLESCADVQALTARVPPPADPALRARVEALEREMSRVAALRAAGKFPEALAAARRVSGEVRKVPFPPTEAKVLFLLGDLEERAGEFAAAERTLRRAVARAEAAGDDESKAEASIALMYVVGEDLSRFDEAHQWEELAEATVRRLGSHDVLAGQLANDRGTLYEAEGRFQESLRWYREAASLRRRAYGPRSPRVAAAMANAGVSFYALGRYEEALKMIEEAKRIQTEALGPDHPEVADSLNRIGGVRYAQGRLEEALAAFRGALEVRRSAFGLRHRLVADSLSNVGSALDDLGRHQEALAHFQQVLEIRREIFGPDHPETATTLDDIGEVYASLRQWDEALKHHQQALAFRRAKLGDSHPFTGTSLRHLGRDLNALGRSREAVSAYREALAIDEKARGEGHPSVAESLTALADLERRAGHPGQALAPLERALKIVESQELDPVEVARTRFALARALWESGGDRERALKLARQARDGFATAGETGKVEHGEVEAWLARRTDDKEKNPLG